MTRHLWSRWALLAAGEAVAVGFLLAPDPRRHLAPYLLLFFAGAAIAIFAAARILPGSGMGFLLLCGALLRATLVARAPELSDDVYRYLWDGSVAARGISPYAFAPEEAAVSGTAPDLAPRVAHRDIRSVYPPVAQAAFRVFGGRGGAYLWKAFAATADLAVVALLSAAAGPGAGFAAALYAFHPLPVTEAAGEGHVDSLGVALLLAALLHLSRGRRVSAGIGFALSVLTKYVSAAAAIPLLRRGRLGFLVGATATAAGLWIAATRGDVTPVGGLGQYATRWDFNSPLYAGSVRLMDATGLPDRVKGVFLDLKEKLGHPAWTQKVFPYFYSAFFARALLGSLLAVLLLWIGLRVADVEAAVFASLAALLALSPTLYPWYLLWVVPFAARRREPAFLYLSFAAPLSYALVYPLPGAGPALILALELIPFAFLLAWTLRRRGAEATA